MNLFLCRLPCVLFHTFSGKQSSPRQRLADMRTTVTQCSAYDCTSTTICVVHRVSGGGQYSLLCNVSWRPRRCVGRDGGSGVLGPTGPTNCSALRPFCCNVGTATLVQQQNFLWTDFIWKHLKMVSIIHNYFTANISGHVPTVQISVSRTDQFFGSIFMRRRPFWRGGGRRTAWCVYRERGHVWFSRIKLDIGEFKMIL